MAAETKQFQTEVQELLNIVVHSLYSNPDIFLRELISNSSDAIDLARFEGQTNKNIIEEDPDWKIKIIPDKEARTLTVSDNGIGMSWQEVEENIGTIARSGTKQLLEQIKQQGGSLSPELIGQFGVGFYSAFIVADKVSLVTRRADASPEEGVQWESDGQGSYSIDQVHKEKRGTEVTLHLKEEDDYDEYLEEWKIRKIVSQYSDFVEHPVVMDIEREEKPKDEEGNVKEDAEAEKVVREEKLNSQKALWRRPRNEIGEEEYHEFYRHISHDFQEPLDYIHWNVEGTTEFTGLLFIPKHVLPEMTMPENRHRGVQLYVRRVYITDNSEALLPQYLRFLRGVVDCPDLPLNISREMLQEERRVRVIQNNIIKKVVDRLTEMKKNERETYVEFWKQFGSILKEGVYFDMSNREKLQDLLLYETSATEPGSYISMQEYVDRMPEEQKEIYFVTGEDRRSVEKSPYLEAVVSRGYEVLFMTDAIDEWVVQGMTEYDGKPLKSIAKGDLDLESEDEKEEKEQERQQKREQYQSLVEFMQEKLSEKVKEVRISNRLTDSACCLVTDEHGMDVHMEKILRSVNQEVPQTKRILEINPDHRLIQNMEKLVEKDDNKQKLEEYADVLYNQALLTAGLELEDPLQFSQRVTQLMAADAEQHS